MGTKGRRGWLEQTRQSMASPEGKQKIAQTVESQFLCLKFYASATEERFTENSPAILLDQKSN